MTDDGIVSRRMQDARGAVAAAILAAWRRSLRRRRASLAARLLVSLVSVLAGLVVCELVVRVAGPNLPGSFSTRALQERHPIYGVFHRPGAAAWVRDQEFTTYVRFNRDGLRGADIGPPSPDILRVLMLGDSFVEGAEVDEEDAVSSVVARLLKEHGTPVEVLNAGVRGWGTAQEYLYLVNQGLTLQPDIVVMVLYVGNDLVDNSIELSPSEPDGDRTRPYFTLRDDTLTLVPVQVPAPSRLSSWATTARSSSALFSLIESGVIAKLGSADQAEAVRETDRLTFASPQPPAFERSWAITRALIVAARDAAEANGARFVLVIAPHKAQLDPAEMKRLVRGDVPRGLQSWDPDLPSRQLAALATRDGVELVHLLPAFRDAAPAAPLYFAENSHWTSAGHGLAASVIAEVLLAEATRSRTHQGVDRIPEIISSGY